MTPNCNRGKKIMRVKEMARIAEVDTTELDFETLAPIWRAAEADEQALVENMIWAAKKVKTFS